MWGSGLLVRERPPESCWSVASTNTNRRSVEEEKISEQDEAKVEATKVVKSCRKHQLENKQLGTVVFSLDPGVGLARTRRKSRRRREKRFNILENK